jgi:hypothetical protein
VSTIAIRQSNDFLKFIAASVVALLFVALLMRSAARTAPIGVNDVPLKPCSTCAKCACPKILGSVSCGCPR